MNDRNFQEDHDSLVRIETLLKASTENFLRYQQELAERMAMVEGKVIAAHRRMDYLLGGVIVSIVGIAVSMIK